MLLSFSLTHSLIHKSHRLLSHAAKEEQDYGDAIKKTRTLDPYLTHQLEKRLRRVKVQNDNHRKRFTRYNEEVNNTALGINTVTDYDEMSDESGSDLEEEDVGLAVDVACAVLENTD